MPLPPGSCDRPRQGSRLRGSDARHVRYTDPVIAGRRTAIPATACQSNLCFLFGEVVDDLRRSRTARMGNRAWLGGPLVALALAGSGCGGLSGNADASPASASPTATSATPMVADGQVRFADRRLPNAITCPTGELRPLADEDPGGSGGRSGLSRSGSVAPTKSPRDMGTDGPLPPGALRVLLRTSRGRYWRRRSTPTTRNGRWPATTTLTRRMRRRGTRPSHLLLPVAVIRMRADHGRGPAGTTCLGPGQPLVASIVRRGALHRSHSTLPPGPAGRPEWVVYH
jgi:hypothetical protein